MSCSITQIYTQSLRYLSISLLGATSQWALSLPAVSVPAFPSFIVPLAPYGVKTAGTVCTYEDPGGPSQTIKAGGMSISTMSIILMDESMNQLTWDGTTTGWEFYLVLKAEK